MFINIGIDLGTTNSGIGIYKNGKVEIIKNPIGFKETLPSVVAFRKNRLIVGEKAIELLKVSPENVFSSFKRKMGTDSTYFSTEVEDSIITPVKLSSFVLKELLAFNQDIDIKSAVITIPASFDTIQSNATKEAGYEAGLKEVVLLQEPIAACLAYSNAGNLNIEEEQNWLVYDFGGGTFDAALIKITKTELKIIDHEGNNFLGGVDIDYAIVEKLFIPLLEKELNESTLWADIKSNKTTFHKKLHAELLYKAELLKKELSISETSFFELDLVEKDIYVEENVTRNQLNEIVAPFFNESYLLIEKLIAKNNISFNSINKIVLVGGTTYIPYIKNELKNRTQVEVDTNIDPTTAVIAGATFYAGTKNSSLTFEEKTIQENSPTANDVATTETPKIKWIYEATSKDTEELLTGVFDQNFEGYFRITRNDGGFDTGLTKFSGNINEFVPVIEKTVNAFQIKIYNNQQNLVAEYNDIRIACGLYNVVGQPLPNDISIEVDGDDGKTILEKIFKKNDILPLKKTIFKTISKTILKNTADKLIINILEGDANNLPASNFNIGYIEISGNNFGADLYKGTDIEINFEISESRDLSVNIYISSIDLELNEKFTPSKKTVSIEKIKMEVKQVIDDVKLEIDSNVEDENFEYLAKLKEIFDELKILYSEIKKLDQNDSTDARFQIEDRKRNSIQKFDNLIRIKDINAELEEFEYLVNQLERDAETMTTREKDQFNRIKSLMSSFENKSNKYLLKTNNKKLNDILYEMESKKIDYYINIFYFLIVQDEKDFSNYQKVETLIPMGRKAIENNNYAEIKSIVYQIYNYYINKNDGELPGTNMTIGFK